MSKKIEEKSQEDTTSKTANSEKKKDIRINKYSPSFDKFLKEFGKDLEKYNNRIRMKGLKEGRKQTISEILELVDKEIKMWKKAPAFASTHEGAKRKGMIYSLERMKEKISKLGGNE